MKEEENNREVIGIIDCDEYDAGNMIPEYNKNIKRIWPLHIYPCQKIDFFGPKMYTVQYFQVCGSRIIWVVSSLNFHFKPLWNTNPKSEMQGSEWQEYIMTNLTENCLSFLNRRAVGIFKLLSTTELENIFKSLTDIGYPFHESFLFYFYHRLCK